MLFCFYITFVGDDDFVRALCIIIIVFITISIVAIYVGRRRFSKKIEPEFSIIKKWKQDSIRQANEERDNAIDSIATSDPINRITEISRIKYENESRIETIESEYRNKIRDLFKAKGLRCPYS